MKPKQKNLQKDILFILISSFIVVAAWIGFNLYHIWATSTVAPDIQQDLTPISPVFDPQIMDQLKTRENIQPLFESQKGSADAIPTPTIPPQLISPTPLVSPTPAANPTSAVSETPSPIPSGAAQNSPSNSPIDRVGQ